MKYLKLIIIALSFSFLQGCNEDETTIKLYDSVGLYSYYYTKVDVKIYIKPTITGFPLATYTWINTKNGEILDDKRVLSYTFTKKGIYKLQLEVQPQKEGKKQIAVTNVVVQ